MRALWSGLIDDAAVFPPGNAPLDVAIEGHDGHRAAPYADCVGPLLVPTNSVDDLKRLTAGRRQPLAVSLVARPGIASADIEAAASNAARCRTIRVVSIELGWVEGWRDLDLPRVPLVLEIPRGSDHDRALADVQSGLLEGRAVRAKFRTGPTPTWAWPDEAELAEWFAAAAALNLPIKLTGGLHHAVRGRYVAVAGLDQWGAPHETREQNHGLLNVLLAAHAAADGSSADHLQRLLEIREGRDLADLVRSWDEDAIRLSRSLFTAFGCCEVTDPVTELAGFDLLTKD